jgi:hypothetical protein
MGFSAELLGRVRLGRVAARVPVLPGGAGGTRFVKSVRAAHLQQRSRSTSRPRLVNDSDRCVRWASELDGLQHDSSAEAIA